MGIFLCRVFRRSFGFTPPSYRLAQVSGHTTATTVETTVTVTKLLLQCTGCDFLWPTKRSANCELGNGDNQCSDIT